MTFSVSRPTSATLAGVVEEQSGQPFSYREVGATADGAVPDGYRHVRQVLELGRGEETFERASEGLRRWHAHLGAGATVHPHDVAAAEGLTVVLAIRISFVWVMVACRVVYVTDHPTRRGFAYGTLPQHVIDGEEVFAIERDDDGVVRFAVSAFLRPRGSLMGAAGPLVHGMDGRLVRRYLRGLHEQVAGAR